MNLAGMTFRAIANSKNGSLNTETEMRFLSDDGVVVGSYSGGTIATGHVLARRNDDGSLNMLYQGATSASVIQAGQALARLTTDTTGDVFMELDWQWLTGDRSKGQSKWILVR